MVENRLFRDLDVGGQAELSAVASVDGVSAAGDQVVGDEPVGLVGEVLEQADGVGLVDLVEDRVVADRHHGGAAVGGGAVDVVAGA